MWWATWMIQMERTGRYRFWSRRGTGILSLAWCYRLWNGCWKCGPLPCARSSCWSLSWSPCNAGDHRASRLVTVPRKLSRCPARSHPAPRAREASVHLYQNKPVLHYHNWQTTNLLLLHCSTERMCTVYKFIWVKSPQMRHYSNSLILPVTLISILKVSCPTTFFTKMV